MNPNTEHTEVYQQDGSDFEPLPDLPPGHDLEPLRVPEIEIEQRARELGAKRTEATLAREVARKATDEGHRLQHEYVELVVASRREFEGEYWEQIKSRLVALDPSEPNCPF